MLEPDQSLKVEGSPVYPNWSWNYVYDLIMNSTTFSTRCEVHNSIRIPIRDVSYFQLRFRTKISVKKDLRNIHLKMSKMKRFYYVIKGKILGVKNVFYKTSTRFR